MKKFFPIVFIVCNVLLAVFAFLSFSEAYARDEGRLRHTLYNDLLVKFFNVIRFPTHVLFPVFTKPPLYFALGLIVNCMFYSLIIERLVYYTAKIWPDEENTA